MAANTSVEYILYALMALLVVAFVVGLIFALLQLAEQFSKLGSLALQGVETGGSAVAGFGLFVAHQVENVTVEAAQAVAQILSAIGSALERITQETGDFILYLFSQASTAFDGVANLLTDLAGNILSTIQHFGRRVFNILEDIAGFLLQYVVAPIAILLAQLVSFAALLIELFIQFVFDPLIRPLINALADPIDTILGLARSLMSCVNQVIDTLSSLAGALGGGGIGSFFSSGFDL